MIESLQDLVDSICRVVYNTMNFGVRSSVNIGQQPVAHDICLDSPGEGQRSIGLNKIHKLGFRVLDRARGALEGECFLALSALSRSLFSLDRKLKNVCSSLQCIYWIREGAFREWVCRNLASEERVSVREDRSIFTDLRAVSNYQCGRKPSLTLTLKSALSMSRSCAVCLKLTWAMPFEPT